MWMLFSFIAVVSLGLNVGCFFTNRKAELFRFISLSSTALCVCAFYDQNKMWVINEDYSALMDVVPTISNVLWIFVIMSILLNSISLIKRNTH